MSNALTLYDYRCLVADHYRQRNQALLTGADPATVLHQFRVQRDHLFASHSQSALDKQQRARFQGLPYFPYNPALRFVVDIDTNVEPTSRRVTMDAQESMTMTTIGQVHFTIDARPVQLSLYWLEIYGGGLFLPFKDTTCPSESYGGGRYLFDTIKGSTPVPVAGESGMTRIMLDFNYAYNPSCAYNIRWMCPLAPPENTLDVAIRAGEMNFHDET